MSLHSKKNDQFNSQTSTNWGLGRSSRSDGMSVAGGFNPRCVGQSIRRRGSDAVTAVFGERFLCCHHRNVILSLRDVDFFSILIRGLKPPATLIPSLRDEPQTDSATRARTGLA